MAISPNPTSGGVGETLSRCISSGLPVIRPESKAKGRDRFLLADFPLPIFDRCIACWHKTLREELDHACDDKRVVDVATRSN